jgi:death-on-curing protein
MHFELLARHGGLRGLKDENALESALARPRHRWLYEPGVDLCALAAAYGFALARSHCYADGNKRIAFATMFTFLGMNGLELDAPEPEVVRVVIDLAAGTIDEAELARWLRARVRPFPEEGE